MADSCHGPTGHANPCNAFSTKARDNLWVLGLFPSVDAWNMALSLQKNLEKLQKTSKKLSKSFKHKKDLTPANTEPILLTQEILPRCIPQNDENFSPHVDLLHSPASLLQTPTKGRMKTTVGHRFRCAVHKRFGRIDMSNAIEQYVQGLQAKNLRDVPFTDDVVFDGIMDQIQGKAAFLKLCEEFFGMVSALRVHQVLTNETGGTVVYEFDSPAGTIPIVDVLTVRDGAISRAKPYFNPMPLIALQQQAQPSA